MNQPCKWWQDTIVYQIYPRSFFDSNGDGEGDLAGIAQKVDYIKSLGVDVVWSSPYFVSPKADGGYDVADYRDIDPLYGNMEDWKNMIAAVHNAGMKFVMDLVANHSSDEHPWFVSAVSDPDSPYRDFYYFRQGKPDGSEPSNWASVFGGSAWEKIGDTNEYYLHLFAKKQPDLNWSNPKMVNEIVDIMNFWCDLGVDGFRLDAINYLYKVPTFPDVEPMPGSKYGFANQYYTNLPPVHDHFKDLNRRVWSPRNTMTVAELAYVDMQTAQDYCAPERKELDMLYLFDILNIDQEGFDKFAPKPLDLPLLKRTLNYWQQGLHDKGWLALFIGNHDQPRAVSRFGSDTTYRVQTAKMIANAMYMLQGTPYIFQGDEIGMTNLHFESIDQFRDVEVLNAYEEHVKQNGEDETHWIDLFNRRSRDNGRSPMQWDNTPNGGFSTGKPWMDVNDNYQEINVAQNEADPDSVLNFYRKLIAFRKHNDTIIYGKTEFVDMEDAQLMVYTRTYKDKMLLCVNNFSDMEIPFAMPACCKGKQGAIALQNYSDTALADVMTLRPYECLTITFE